MVKLRLHNDFAPYLPINDSMRTDQLEYYITLDCDWLGGGHMAQDGLIRAKEAYFWDIDGNRMKSLCFHPGCLLTTGRPHFIALQCIVLHKWCFGLFFLFSSQIESPTLHRQKDDDSLHCNPCFAVAAWNRTCNTLRWACSDLLALDSSGRTWERLSENKANREESKAVTWREREGLSPEDIVWTPWSSHTWGHTTPAVLNRWSQ